MKYLDRVEMSNLLLSVLWVVFCYPLYCAFSNAWASEEIQEECIELPKIEVIEDIKGDIIPKKEVKTNQIDLTDITVLNTNGYIWETENEFNQAFRMARSLLGPDETFEWKNDLYHTNYQEEMNLLTTKEQEFLQIAE